VGGGVLCRRDLLRVLAFCVWTLVVRSEVGDHARTDRAPALGIRLLPDRGGICGCGRGDNVFVFDDAAAAVSTGGRRD